MLVQWWVLYHAAVCRCSFMLWRGANCSKNRPSSTINAVYVGGPCHLLSQAGAASSRCSSALFIFYSLGTFIKTPAAIPPHGVNRVYRGPLVYLACACKLRLRLRLVNIWKSLPEHRINCNTVNTFKTHISHGLEPETIYGVIWRKPVLTCAIFVCMASVASVDSVNISSPQHGQRTTPTSDKIMQMTKIVELQPYQPIKSKSTDNFTEMLSFFVVIFFVFIVWKNFLLIFHYCKE